MRDGDRMCPKDELKPELLKVKNLFMVNPPLIKILSVLQLNKETQRGRRLRHYSDFKYILEYNSAQTEQWILSHMLL